MGQIQVMSEALANQIAAGEVVERPASCVKELIENSLDAGATAIQVAVEDGGISGIVVQDNGCGMDAEDARLAFARHATSKLRSSRDLFEITTLGFRGEALASIAAVSRVILQTRQADAEYGAQLRVEGSEAISPVTPIGMPPGTRIEVKDLFYNTPARLKYLRTVATEQARVVEVVQRMALGRPDVSFACLVNGNPVFRSPGRTNMQQALGVLYGTGEANQFVRIEGATADYQVLGYIGRPTQAKSARSHGYLYVNGRPIRNLALHQAIVGGYQNRLMVNRHPMYAIAITLDPKLVDVNIHPHKAEVRFSEERDLTLLLQRTVREALDGAFLVPSMPLTHVNSNAVHRTTRDGNQRPVEQPLFNQSFAERVSSESRERPPGFVGGRQTSAQRPSIEAVRAALDSTLRVTDPSDGHYAHTADTSKCEPEQATAAAADSAVRAPELSIRKLRPIGQALGMYILADDGENIYIIDQHAAHERVLYEKFFHEMRSQKVLRLPLLTPLTITLSPSQFVLIQPHLEVLAEMGLEAEPFGGSDIVVRTVPHVWEGLPHDTLTQDVLQGLCDDARTPDVRNLVRERIVMRACKAAIKANHYMSTIEMEALCQALANLEDPFHCPHGRPVFIQITNRELEKGFKRIV